MFLVSQTTPNNTSGQVASGNVQFQLNARRWSLGEKFYYIGNTFRVNYQLQVVIQF